MTSSTDGRSMYHRSGGAGAGDGLGSGGTGAHGGGGGGGGGGDGRYGYGNGLHHLAKLTEPYEVLARKLLRVCAELRGAGQRELEPGGWVTMVWACLPAS
jgi:hypothetical protein